MCMKKFTDLKIAIVHDNFRYFGGAERVVEALYELWPTASVYTSTVSWSDLAVFSERVATLKPIISWAQHIPFFSHYPFLYRYILPLIWWSFDFSQYDVVISSSYAQMSHLIKVPRATLHICYSHSPPRHLYGLQTDFPWEKLWFFRPVILMLNQILRRMDYRAAQRVTWFVANSKTVARRIEKIYKRPACVIFPPCTFSGLKKRQGRKRDGYFLVVSRLSRVKYIDLVIHACNVLHAPLKVVGVGSQESALRRLAGSTVEFIGHVSDQTMESLYIGAKAVICAAEDEDFGIVPVEAMSFGRPVIAYFSGGHTETIIEGKTGVFFKTLTIASLRRAIIKLENLHIDPDDCVRQAARFSIENFKKQMTRFVEQKYYEHIISQP